MNRYSAYAAIVVAVIYVAFGVVQYYYAGGDGLSSLWDWASYVIGFPHTLLLWVAPVILFVGAQRVLTNQSGGLRLLCGAWGLSIGSAIPDAVSPLFFFIAQGERPAFTPLEAAAWAAIVVVSVLSIAGLAMTVLHKERKSAAPAS